MVDIMLGKLAKWLRVMGHDARYRSFYKDGTLEVFMTRGRILLTRHHQRARLPGHSILLHKNRVDEQLAELSETVDLKSDPDLLFSRCIRCNTLLEDAPGETALEAVPEYIFYHHPGQIRFCPTCERYYWPGSHRMRMADQLRAWGFMGTET
ncbi:MAG: Mut7-C RNAse domain-containing protein [Deltaproteobacteria bacterium]|nr:Mut7-C RNAse domain-containing protein [Deltaproteobacteria bacterium]